MSSGGRMAKRRPVLRSTVEGRAPEDGRDIMVHREGEVLHRFLELVNKIKDRKAESRNSDDGTTGPLTTGPLTTDRGTTGPRDH